jgi:hypothetical protein
MVEYKVINGEGVGSVDLDCKGLLDAYKGLVKAKTREDLKTVVLSVGTSVAEGTIDIKSASLFVFLAQIQFNPLHSDY